MSIMIENYQLKARTIVLDYIKTEVSDPTLELNIGCVFVVWFCKTLQNWKALVSTTLSDGKYYEVTYDGDKKQSYLDVYAKFTNERIVDEADDIPVVKFGSTMPFMRNIPMFTMNPMFTTKENQ
jgi:hypothetical protein